MLQAARAAHQHLRLNPLSALSPSTAASAAAFIPAAIDRPLRLNSLRITGAFGSAATLVEPIVQHYSRQMLIEVIEPDDD